MRRVSEEEYVNAVIACLKVAQIPTHGGRSCAEVLLSAYNGYDFQVDISGLTNLDRRNFENAITVILGRTDLRHEPHEVINDGDQVFKALRKQWIRLEITERAKIECPTCKGHGQLSANPWNPDGEKINPCERCSGTGRVCRCEGR